MIDLWRPLFPLLPFLLWRLLSTNGNQTGNGVDITRLYSWRFLQHLIFCEGTGAMAGAITIRSSDAGKDSMK